MHGVGVDQRWRRVGVPEHGEPVLRHPDGLHRTRIGFDDMPQTALAVEHPQVRLPGTADHHLVLDLRVSQSIQHARRLSGNGSVRGVRQVVPGQFGNAQRDRVAHHDTVVGQAAGRIGA
jgi:hypothetical protein